MAYVLVSHGIREFGRREWNRQAARRSVGEVTKDAGVDASAG